MFPSSNNIGLLALIILSLSQTTYTSSIYSRDKVNEHPELPPLEDGPLIDKEITSDILQNQGKSISKRTIKETSYFVIGLGFAPIHIKVTYLDRNIYPNPPKMNTTFNAGRFGADDEPPHYWGVVEENDNDNRNKNPVTIKNEVADNLPPVVTSSSKHESPAATPDLVIDYENTYFKTPTGISLEPIPALRPQSRPPPPIAHGSSASGSK